MNIVTIFLILLFTLPLSAQSQDVETIEVAALRSDFFKLITPAQESLTDKQMDERNLIHGEDLWSQFSNMSTASSTNRVRYIKIRGIGERSEYDTIPSNSVGVFYDHIDLSGLSGILSLYDVARVDVLKGPQTFFFGDSALGGNVLFTSRFDQEDNGSVWAGLGSQNHSQAGARAHFSLSDSFSMKLGFQKMDSDGFFYNNFLNEYTSQRDEFFSNLGWQWELGPSLLRVSHIFGENRNGNDFWNTDRSFTVRSDNRGHDDQLTHGHSFEWTGPLNSHSLYMFTGSFSQSDQLVSYDEDWNNNAYWNTVPGWNKDYDFFKVYNRRKTNIHLKSILQYRKASWDLSGGLHFYQKEELTDINSFRRRVLNNSLIADFMSDKLALLFNIGHRVNAVSRISLSSRMEHQRVDYSDTDGFNRTVHNNPFAFNLNYTRETATQTWQFIISRGFRGAGFNPEINLTSEQQQYDPEYTMNYEVSWEQRNKSLQNKITVFYMDRRHHQITTSSQDDPSDPSDFTIFVDNAARSEHLGLEWQGQWNATPGIRVQANTGLMQARFVDYQLRNRSYRGRELAHSPSYTFALTTLFDLTSWLQWNLNVTGRDGFFYSNSHDEVSEPIILLNGNFRAQLSSSWVATLWGRNLLDQQHSQRGFFFGNEPPQFTARLYEQNAPPLEWGVRLTYDF